MANYSQARNRQIIDEARSVPCKDCGIIYPTECMEFDHLPQFKKLKNVSHMLRYSVERLMAEIAKCEVVCANCHNIRTRKRFYSRR